MNAPAANVPTRRTPSPAFRSGRPRATTTVRPDDSHDATFLRGWLARSAAKHRALLRNIEAAPRTAAALTR